MRRATRVALATIGAVAVVAALFGVPPAQAAGGTYVVNTTNSAADSTPGDGICRTSTGVCSLRAALMEDAADDGPTTINFNIAGAGPHQIVYGAGTLFVADPGGGTTIDGYTQPGASPNTAALGSNADLRIELVGTGNNGPMGLDISTPNNTVRGLAIRNMARAIRMVGPNATGNRIVGNFIGTNTAGTWRQTVHNANTFGVLIVQTASGNFVGSPTLADRNIIAGNGGRGVAIFDFESNDNVIKNNMVGLTPAGNAALPNTGHGIDVNTGAKRNIIGGTGANERNVSSANRGSGIEVSHGFQTRDNQVIGNFFGTDVSGMTAPSWAKNGQVNFSLEDNVVGTIVTNNVFANNDFGGLKLHKGSSGTRIENNLFGMTANGTSASNGPYGVQAELGVHDNTLGPGNIIANNATGVRLLDADVQRIEITQNLIFNNAGLGIDINPIGVVNQNDAGDSDTGPNTLLNFPVITTATESTISGTACAGCRVELFLADSTSTNPALNASYGEGQLYLASTVASGSGNFSLAVPSAAKGNTVTTTATDAQGNTSEFSRNVLVPGTSVPNDPPVASFTSSCAFQVCSFDGSGSFDPDGSIVAYSWNFGDGQSAAGATTSHAFASSGTYPVSLTVTDDRGSSTTLTQDISVVAQPNDPPEASYTFSCDFLACSFDGSGSFDPDGSIVAYSWDFDDGQSASGATPAHTFVAGGTYQVALTVTDNLGKSATVTHDVVVTAPPTFDLAIDAFSRVVANGWGSATLGGPWTARASFDAPFLSVNGSAGVLAVDAIKTRGAFLNNVVVGDVDIRGVVSSGSALTDWGAYVSLAARRNGNAWYGATVRMTGTGSVVVSAMNTATVLGSQVTVSGLTWSVDTPLNVRFRVTGSSPTTLQVKVWAVGSPEPADWQVTRTDSAAALQGAGAIGFVGYSSVAGTVNLRLEDLHATVP